MCVWQRVWGLIELEPGFICFLFERITPEPSECTSCHFGFITFIYCYYGPSLGPLPPAHFASSVLCVSRFLRTRWHPRWPPGPVTIPGSVCGSTCLRCSPVFRSEFVRSLCLATAHSVCLTSGSEELGPVRRYWAQNWTAQTRWENAASDFDICFRSITEETPAVLPGCSARLLWFLLDVAGTSLFYCWQGVDGERWHKRVRKQK